MSRRRRKTRVPANIQFPAVWRRRPIAALAMLLLAGLVVYERGLGGLDSSDDFTKYHNRVFVVVKVVDGDTLDVDVPDGKYPHTRIRLWGVDTPEVAGSRDGAMHFGAEASAFAKGRLVGKDVRLVLSPNRSRDKYERLLAYVYCTDIDEMFNEALVREGMAYADRRFDHPFKQQFRRVEDRARRAGVGLWANVRIEDMPAWRQRLEQRDKSD